MFVVNHWPPFQIVWMECKAECDVLQKPNHQAQVYQLLFLKTVHFITRLNKIFSRKASPFCRLKKCLKTTLRFKFMKLISHRHKTNFYSHSYGSLSNTHEPIQPTNALYNIINNWTQ
jgi:hypothetical protein